MFKKPYTKQTLVDACILSFFMDCYILGVQVQSYKCFSCFGIKAFPVMENLFLRMQTEPFACIFRNILSGHSMKFMIWSFSAKRIFSHCLEALIYSNPFCTTSRKTRNAKYLRSLFPQWVYRYGF